MRITTPRLVFTLCVLLGINTMNFFDRQILPAVQENIRKDWKLSDSELGWLGTAFILLYAVVGLPLGHLADVWRRRWILARLPQSSPHEPRSVYDRTRRRLMSALVGRGGDPEGLLIS